MISLLKNRLFILFLVVLVVNIFLKKYMNYDLFNLSKNNILEGYTGKEDLPCVEYPKNIDDPVELQINVERLIKSTTQTVAALDKIIGESIKKKHSDKLFKSRVDAFFLKVEEKCSKIKIDGKMYSYKDISSLKNLTKNEKKALNEYNKQHMKKFEEEASNSDKKKLQKLKKEIMDNFKKFGEAKKKYDEKGKDSKNKIYLTNEKIQDVLAAMMETGIPAFTLINALFNRIKYKPAFKKNRARYLIDSEITGLKGLKDLSEKLLKSKMYKEFSS